MKTMLTVAAAATATLLFAAAPATAATGVYPDWAITPSSTSAQNHSGTVDFGVHGVPRITYTVNKTVNDTRPVRLRTANSSGDWLTSHTGFGSVFGPSGPGTKEFLSMGADYAGTSTEVTATFTFTTTLPAGLLGIVIGDVDVENSTLNGVSGSGGAMSGAQLQGTVASPPFNFCNVPAPKPTSCAGVSTFPVPTWVPKPTGGEINGATSPGVDDTDGASAWFRPAGSMRSFTFHFSGVKGASSSHSSRLWLAVLKGNISGHVTIQGEGMCQGCQIHLYAPWASSPSATATTDSHGHYAFPDWAALPGYRVVLVRPGGYHVVGQGSKTADIHKSDAVVNFLLARPGPPAVNPRTPKPRVVPTRFTG